MRKVCCKKSKTLHICTNFHKADFFDITIPEQETGYSGYPTFADNNFFMTAKIISLKMKPEPTGCAVEKISLAECREILNTEGIVYTDEEIIVVRDFIHQLAEINYLCYLNLKQQQNQTKVIDINTNNEHQTQSHTLHPGKYRRTG